MIDITKDELESLLSVATSAQMQVYEKTKPAVQDAADRCVREVLGAVGEAALDTSADSFFLRSAKRYICLDAFLAVLRQLDLVLTPTGFGVVANNTTSPASKERVNALHDQLALARERARGELLECLQEVEGWGTTVAASRQIRTVFYDVRELERMCDRETTMEEWKAMLRVAKEVDVDFRRLFGNAQMDDIVLKLRSGATSTSTAYADVVRLMQEITFLRAWHSPSEPERMRRLQELVEFNATTYTIYMNSNEYKVNHYERFQNKQDSPGFCFVG